MIRPKEMAKLKLEYFNIKEQTILIPGSISKNKKTSTVTIPQKVIFLMIDLGIFNNPSKFYLFSKDFKPGSEFVTEKRLSDYWVFKIRRNLGFPLEYKFYSLKDSGITTMLHKEDVLTVRNQARHSSISITNAYASGIAGANPDLKNYDGSL
jgi:integrase